MNEIGEIGLFLDTAGNKFVIGLVKNKKLLAFSIKQTDNNVVKYGIFWLKDFLFKNNIEFNQLTEIYLTIGPGSFTGTKVGPNIISTLALVNKKLAIYTIDNFSLFKTKKPNVAIQISKQKYLLQKSLIFNFKKTKIINLDSLNLATTTLSYDSDFTPKLIETKIRNNAFNLVENPLKIALIFADDMIKT